MGGGGLKQAPFSLGVYEKKAYKARSHFHRDNAVMVHSDEIRTRL